MIHIVKGDATGAKSGILVHVVNDVGAWGKGFVLAVSRRWPHVKAEYKKHWQEYKLGQVQIVEATPQICIGTTTAVSQLLVGNMFSQRGIHGMQCLRYGALKKCLREVASFALGSEFPVHMPKIGCGLAGGEWVIVRDLIEQEMNGLDVTVYEWEREARHETE